MTVIVNGVAYYVNNLEEFVELLGTDKFNEVYIKKEEEENEPKMS